MPSSDFLCVNRCAVGRTIRHRHALDPVIGQKTVVTPTSMPVACAKSPRQRRWAETRPKCRLPQSAPTTDLPPARIAPARAVLAPTDSSTPERLTNVRRAISLHMASSKPTNPRSRNAFSPSRLRCGLNVKRQRRWNRRWHNFRTQLAS